MTELANITMEDNSTELVEKISYDVTELRMDPDYIRFKRGIFTILSVHTVHL